MQQYQYGAPANSIDDGQQKAEALAAAWIDTLRKAERSFSRFRDDCKKVESIYLVGECEADYSSSRNETSFALLHSNTNTIMPALYSRTPNAVATRRHKDPDPISRQGAEVMERSLNYSASEQKFDQCMQKCVFDYVLNGMGVARIRYHAEIGQELIPQEPIVTPEGEVIPQEPIVQEVIEREIVYPEHVNLQDFLCQPARTWDEVNWVAFRGFQSREENIEMFGEEVGAQIPLDHCPVGKDGKPIDDTPGYEKKSTIYEVWDRKSKKRLFIHKNWPHGPLKVEDPPISFANFFPCPAPMLGAKTNASLIPKPDYFFYKTQADDIDLLTSKIKSLSNLLTLKGVYAGEHDATLQQTFNSEDNEIAPMPNWEAFLAGGGFNGVIQFFPTEKVERLLQSCIATRAQIIDDVYQITGISDIVRGASDPNETATAQGIKAQWGSIRIQDRQKVVARFAGEIFQLMGEVIAEIFQPESLAEMTGMQIQPEVYEMLRNDMLRRYRIDVESDSMIEPDENQEKQRRTEFLQAVGEFIQQMLPVAQQVPQMAPMVGQMLMFGVRGFRAGRELEEVIEQTMQQLADAATAPQQEGPDPEAEAMQQKLELERQKASGELQIKQARVAGELAIKQQQQSARDYMMPAQGGGDALFLGQA